MKRSRIAGLLAAAVVAFAVSRAGADLELNVTTGKDNFQQRSADFNFNLVPDSRLTLGFTDYRSDVSPYFTVYWGGIEWTRAPCFSLIANLIIRPEQLGYDFFGWEIIPKLIRKEPSITLAIGFKRYLHTQNVAVPSQVAAFLPVGVRQSVSVAQNWAEPDLAVDVTSRLNLSGSYRHYFYDKDPVVLVERFGYTFLSNVDFTGASTVVMGFPGNALTLRAKYAFSHLFSFEMNWTTLYLIVREIHANTWLYIFTYNLSGRVQLTAKYNPVDSGIAFYTFGMKWLW